MNCCSPAASDMFCSIGCPGSQDDTDKLENTSFIVNFGALMSAPRCWGKAWFKFRKLVIF